MSNITPEVRQLLHRKNFAEFFAGIGLVSAGLKRQKWSISFANDIDPLKYQMYQGHFTDAKEHFVLGDVNNLSAEKVPDTTLATASFPCKDLSLAGSRKGLEGAHSSSYWGFIDILEQKYLHRPPLVLLENVTGLISANNGEDFKQVLHSLNNLDYSVDCFIIDAIKFVPQSRQRLFVIGLRKDIFPAPQENKVAAFGLESDIRPKSLFKFIVKHPEIQWNIRHLPPLPTNELKLENIVENLSANASIWWSTARAEYLLNQMSPRHREIATQMIQDTKWSYGTVFRRMRNNKSTAELRTDGVAGCLRTPAGGSAKQILFKAGYGQYFVRLLTPRECARLMGVGEYNITVPFDQALLGFGDAVCVPVIEWIAENYLNVVIEECMSRTTLETILTEVEQ